VLSRSRLVAGCAAALVPLLAAATATAATRPAAQPNGRVGCVNTRGTEGCAATAGLAGLEATQLAVSPSGRFLYAALQAELIPGPHAPHSRLLVFARDARTGALHVLPGRRGCLEDTVRPVTRQHGACERVGGIEQPFALAVSPDGRQLYVSGGGGRDNGGDYLVTFAVDPHTGALRQLQCLTDQAHSHCTPAPIGSFGELAVSPDSRYVYAADGHRAAMDVYRVTAHGLVLAQCLAATPVSGRNCTTAPLLMEGGVEGLAVSGDGAELYAAGGIGDDASRVVEFRRDTGSGQLTAGSGPGGCVTDSTSPPAGCSQVALAGAHLSLSSDGDTLYAATGTELALAALARDPVTGALSEAASPTACVELADLPDRTCPAVAPRWSGDAPHMAPAPSGGLLVSAVEHRDEGETVVLVARSSTGGALAVSDIRGCSAGACRRLRGANSNQVGAIAISPDGRSVYLAGVHGIAQIRLP
jgi:DNA-binding beta-propeller fold protein YncE